MQSRSRNVILAQGFGAHNRRWIEQEAPRESISGNDLAESSTLDLCALGIVERGHDRLVIGSRQEQGAQVLLVEIPRGFVVDRFRWVDREMGRARTGAAA